MSTRISLLISLNFIFQFCLAQNIQLLEYDCFTKTIDTIDITVDNSDNYGFTPSQIGSFNNYIAELENEFPTDHVYEDSEYTLKNYANEYYNVEDYPIRTTVRLNILNNDSLSSLCSGSIVNSNFVLTAAHCFYSYSHEEQKRVFHDDDYFASPVLNNGFLSGSFFGSRITKIYVPLLNGATSDIALVKLNEPIGLVTGWLGIGFQENDSLLKKELVYKFSYPALSNYLGNGLTFNGDTLFFNYGRLDYFTEEYIGVHEAKGIPGESGSTVFSVNNNSFTAFGVSAHAFKYSHTRITKPIFEAFKSRFKEEEFTHEPSLQVFPNPTKDRFYIFSASKLDVVNYKIYDTQGKCLIAETNYDDINGVSLAHLKPGVYFFQYNNTHQAHTVKVIKTASD